MKEYVVSLSRKWISPSVRFKFGEIAGWLRDQVNLSCIWRWELTRFPLGGGTPFSVSYLGRKSQRDIVMALLGSSLEVDSSQNSEYVPERTAFASELPTPGSLCVPLLLNSIVALGKPIEEIMAEFHSQLRRELKKNRLRYRLQRVIREIEINSADRDMLRPYARARHGETASHIRLDEVRRSAQGYGRLDLLILEDEVVGCQLGHQYTRAGKRYWTTNRCGYPEAVFSEPKKLRDINSINIHLALEWALENGFDFYDIGTSLARPDDGLLEWKRRRGASLARIGYQGYVHIRLPKVGEAQFLWRAPLFAVVGNQLTLHIGLPDGPSDEEAVSRYREMGFGGLFKVYVHCARVPGDHLLETLRSFYANRTPLPIVESIQST